MDIKPTLTSKEYTPYKLGKQGNTTNNKNTQVDGKPQVDKELHKGIPGCVQNLPEPGLWD